ncbi:MAG: SsrA-binding protein SmpB [Rhizobiales bacterium]|nr:SsrA-binding protein SmpB [Hyphomicrobiales bacterium]
MAKKGDGRKVVAENRRARYNFAIEEVIEAGLMLKGSEVKSLRSGKANVAESYAAVEGGELFLINSYIPELENANRYDNHEPRRHRKLLLNRREIDRLAIAVMRDGMTMVPLKIYFNERGMAKLELGLARGKKLHDKRESEKERDWQRQRSRLMRERG